MAEFHNGFGRASLLFSLAGGGDLMVITMGVTDDGTTNPNTIAAAVYTAWIGNFDSDTFSTDGTLEGARVQLQRGADIVDGEYMVPYGGTGAFASPSPAIALLLKKNTASGGRHNRGRCYLPNIFLGELDIDSAGAYDPTARGDTLTRWEGFISDLNATAFDMVVLHTDITMSPTPVTGGSVSPKVVTQRRRQS